MGARALCSFSLGDKPPQLTGIKVYDTDRASDSIIIEADGSWASHQDVQMTVRARHPPVQAHLRKC